MDSIITRANAELARRPLGVELELRAGRLDLAHYDAVVASTSRAARASLAPEFAPKLELTLSIVSRERNARERSSSGTTFIARKTIAREGSDARADVTFIRKTELARAPVGRFKIVLAREDMSDARAPNDNDIVRFRARKSWNVVIGEFAWIVDVTIVRESTYGLVRKDKTIREKFERDMLASAASVASSASAAASPDYFEFEIEYSREARSRALTFDDILQVSDFAASIVPESALCERASRTQARESSARIPMQIVRLLEADQRSRARTLKGLLNNARSMDIVTYTREVFPNIDQYFVTGKADGERGVFAMDAGGRCLLATDSFVLGDTACGTNAREPIALLLDGEAMTTAREDHTTTFFVFDCLVANGKSVVAENFANRIAFAREQTDIASRAGAPAFAVVAKDFYRIENHDVQSAIELARSGQYRMDGIILTQCCANYHATRNYKWKPRESMTIDFLCIDCPRALYGRGPYHVPAVTFAASERGTSDYHIYLLFCECTPQQRRELCIARLDEWGPLIAETVPQDLRERIIHFRCSFEPRAYILVVRERAHESLHGRVVEMLWRTTEAREKSEPWRAWDIIRTRADRTVGNNIAVANSVFANVVAPFELEMLWDPGSSYFDTEARGDLIAGNKYRRFVLTAILHRYILRAGRERSRVLDLGGGRAGDFIRYAAIGARLVVNYDADVHALVEGVARVEKLTRAGARALQTSTAMRWLSAFEHSYDDAVPLGSGIDRDGAECVAPEYIARVADLARMELREFTESLQSAGFEARSFNLVVSSFSFHYFCASREIASRVWSIIDAALANDGVVVITTMDGARVLELLRANEGHWGARGKTKYEIAQQSADSPAGWGVRVQVSVPFAEELREEPLCNFELLFEVAREYGFEPETSIDYGAPSLFEIFARIEDELASDLTEEDKQYAALFRTCIFTRAQPRARAKKERASAKAGAFTSRL